MKCGTFSEPYTVECSAASAPIGIVADAETMGGGGLRKESMGTDE